MYSNIGIMLTKRFRRKVRDPMYTPYLNKQYILLVSPCKVYKTYSLTLCCVADDACDSRPCLHGGQCEARGRGYVCNCFGEITGKQCRSEYFVVYAHLK